MLHPAPPTKSLNHRQINFLYNKLFHFSPPTPPRKTKLTASGRVHFANVYTLGMPLGDPLLPDAHRCDPKPEQEFDPIAGRNSFLLLLCYCRYCSLSPPPPPPPPSAATNDKIQQFSGNSQLLLFQSVCCWLCYCFFPLKVFFSFFFFFSIA